MNDTKLTPGIYYYNGETFISIREHPTVAQEDEFRQTGIGLYAIFRSFTEAGFTRPEALELMKTFIDAKGPNHDME